MCSISCEPGHTLNTADCECVLTDGCEAAGQPCQNGGTCMSDLSATPPYSCQCDAGYTGQNCESQFVSVCVCVCALIGTEIHTVDALGSCLCV